MPSTRFCLHRRKIVLTIFAVLGFALFAGHASGTRANSAAAPNLLVIVADDLGPDKSNGDKEETVGVNPILRNHEPVREIKYLTFELSDQAVAFLERNRGRPFLLYLAYNARHVPAQAPQDYVARFQGERFAIVAALDDAIGQVLDALDRLGLAENTLVIFVGDNGGPEWGTGGLRGCKGQVYEGGIRIPFLARWPARLPAGATYDEPVMHIDLVPTVLAAASLEVPGHLDGVNLLPYWLGEKQGTPHMNLFWGLPPKKYAARAGKWKVVVSQGVPELYDLSNDPREETDLAAQKPEMLREMLEQAEAWQQSTGKPRDRR